MAIKPKGKKVTGTKKADKITWTSSKPWKKALTVDAGAGNDVINFKKSNYNNVLKGGNGNDKIYGGKKVDKIYGGKGNDKLYGYAGNDIIKAGAGKDLIDGGAGNDKIYGESGTNTLKGGAGNDKIYAGTGTDKIYGGAGNDYVDLAKGGKNTVYGDAGADKIVNIKGNSVVDGGADDDTIVAISGSNTLKGGAGNDSITGGTGADNIEGGDGDDIITGGKGNDIINAGAGTNTMIFSEGDGSDTIISGNGTDTVYLTRDLSYYYEERIGNDLVLYYSSVSNEDNIVLKDFFTADHSVKFIGAEGDPTSAIENFYINVNGEGTIDGTRFTEYIYGSDGVDIITAGDAYAEYDFADAGEGNDIINIQNNGSMYLDIYNGDGNDTVNNVANANKLYIWHSYDATVYGYQDGSDYKIVREYTVSGEKQTATTTLTDFVLADHPNIVQMHYNGNYTNLTAFDLEGFTGNSTLIRVPDNNTLEDTSDDNLYILGSNAGDTITTGTGNDVISAGNGNNNITSTGGNNRILAGTGNDTITVSGSGDNYIEVASSSNYPGNVITVNSSGENTIKGGTYYDKIEVNDGTNFIYANGGQDTITLNGGENYVEFNDNNNSAQVVVKTGDATIHGGSNNGFYGTTYIEGSDNTVNMTGSDNRENVYIKSGIDNNLDLGAGNDYVGITTSPSTSTIYTGTGQDTVSIEESAGAETNVTIYGGDSMNGGADTEHNYYSIGVGTAEIHTGSYGDRISVYGENATAVIYGNDSFASGQGDSINAIGSAGVTVYGGNGMNTLTGSYNDDSLFGGDSMDTITSNGGDDIINAGGGDDYIRNDRDTVAGNVEITGGKGDDLIEMNNTHKETLIFNNGDGNDIIRDSRTTAEGAKQDILKFADSNLSDLVLRIDPNNSSNLIIKYNNGQDSVKLENVTYYNDSDVTTSIAKIVTLDNPSGISFDEFLATRSVYDYSDETSGVNFSGTKFSDSIIGSDYGDTFWAGNYTGQDGGNDYIDAGAGNDSIRATFGNNTIIGGTGDDTISMANWTDGGVNTAIFNAGDGMDRVTDFGANSIFKFETATLDNINIQSIYEVYDSYGNAHTRTLITFNNNPADGVILDQNYLDDNNKNAVIGLTESDDTITLGELINNRHVYLADDGAYRNVIIAHPEEFVPVPNVYSVPNAITTEYADHIYISGNFNTIEGGKGNDTIEAIGQIGDDGSLENVQYNKYVINVDEYGNGDGTDTIVNDNTWGWNAIMVKGVGTDVSDTAAQQAFLDNLHCDFVQHDEDDGYDLVIDYATNGRLIFKNVSKEDLSGMSTGKFGFIYPDAEGKYDYYSNYDDATRKYYSNFASYLNIPVNIPSGGSYEANPNYSEVITGDNGWEAVVLNGGDKTVDMKAGLDVIIVKSAEHNGTYTIKMGSDTISDVIWFSDVTDQDNFSVDRSHYTDENDKVVYTNDLIVSEVQNRNASVILKDYFTYASQNNGETIPTFMKICYGEDGMTNSEHQVNLTDLYDNYLKNTEGATVLTGTCFNDIITPAAEIAETIRAGKGNDTIEAFYHDDDTYGNPGADSVYGDDGNDSITYRDYYNPNVEIYGGDGNDEINITSGTAYGGAGSDELYAYGCNDHSHVENDSWHYHEVALYGYSHIYEDPNDDGSVGDTLYSGDKNDTLIGSKGNDSISAGDGKDIIRAGSGDDTIQAGNGDDYIEGGKDDDVIYTNWDASNYQDYESYTNYSGSGYETVDAGAGDDTILAQGNAHTITGGQGDDLIVSSYCSSSDYHFKSGDGNDTIYTSTNSGYHDKVCFDDLIFDGENVKAEYYEQATGNYPANTLVIFYDKNGDNWNSSIQVRNYVSESRLEYLSDISSNLDRLIDKNGNVIYIRDLLNGRNSVVNLSNDTIGTIFNDTVTLADDEDVVYAFNGNYGNDSITGSDLVDNNLYGYDSGYYGWGEVGDGNDYLDGRDGRNNLYGGWGDDTLVGGYDGKTDTMHGGYGANVYDIQRASSGTVTAEIHSSSDKDTLILPYSQYVTFANYDYDLLIDFKRGTSNSDQILLYDWYNNPRDFRITSGNTHTTLYDAMKSATAPDGVEFGEATTQNGFDTQNTSDEKIYLGTSGDDRMYVRYGTIVSGGYGNDSIQAYYAPSTIYGGEGNDTLLGSTGADSIYGGGGIDSIEAGSGDDLIYTASPSEFYYNWNPATSTSYYRMFEQYVRPDSTDDWDYVLAGAGNDTIYAVGENAMLQGGDGNDTYHVTLNNRTYISDTSGTNNIVLHTFQEWGGESTYLVMDVDTAHYFNGDYGVLLMDYDGYRYWLNNACDLSDYKGGYLELSPLKVGGQYGTFTHQNIGTITEIGNSSITGSQIDELKSDLESWFSSVNYAYSSVSDALANGTDEQKAELIGYFTDFNRNAWQSNP